MKIILVSAALVLSLPAALIAQAADSTARRDTLRLPDIEVVGARRQLDRIPGSAQVIDAAQLRRTRPFTVNEALRQVPGVTVRDEEGFGLRPNIGIRGLNPTRSAKVLLLEDGVPFTIAPYGDNASYYHPPVDRFERIEVLKGSGQILYGPQTVGGVINYITPAFPSRAAGTVSAAGGSRGYVNAHARAGVRMGGFGLIVDAGHKQGDGARANTGSRLNDVTLRAAVGIGARNTVTAKANYYGERSRVTYSGLSEAEYAADPRQNPFANDSMRLDRWAGALAHRLDLGGGGTLTTTVYASLVERDWWRQSSNSAERPNDASDPACGGMANLNSTCGNQGRLRRYDMVGVEPRLALPHVAFGVVQRLEAGLRAHFEHQDRRQVNGATPNAREAGPPTDPNSGLREQNLRSNAALAAYVQDQLLLGRVTLTPGVRLEHVTYDRTNELASPAATGHTELTQLIPGLGATVRVAEGATVFAGVHRGFAPPRTEDIVDNSGGVVELDPELSWNYEVGIRATPRPGVSLEGTAFRMDFTNQVIPASLAGGAGSTLTSAGSTLHQGLELSGRLDLAALRRAAPPLFLEVAWTWLPTARFTGERYAYVGTGGADVAGKVYAGQNGAGTRRQVSVTGNRLPYAPAHLLTAAAGYARPGGLELRLETVHTGRQFADPVNTGILVPDGQQGPIAAATVVNVAATLPIGRSRTAAFLAVKNLFDESYVVDRSRGLLPGLPRLVQGGITAGF